MNAAPFDGSQYRREVLVALRERNPSEVDDVFWLAHVPRDADESQITARLRDAKGFLNKERTRARQAAVATAVLKEWPRVEATLTDRGAREALRARLEAVGEQAPQVAERPLQTGRAAGPLTAQERRLRQVAKALDELGRLRTEPEIGEDLFAFLGLPVTAPSDMVRERVELVAEVNRRRRPDRERSLIDDLLIHSRKLLVEGDPAAYRATFGQVDKARAVELLLTGDLDAARGAVDAARSMGVSDGDLQAAVAPKAKANEATVPLSPLGLGVWCPSCGTISPMGSAACHRCRAGLQLRCSSCENLAAADCPRCPSCSALLDAQRAPLLARRAELLRETEALAALKGTPAAELESRLRALVRQNPNWQAAAARLATLPPPPPRALSIAVAGDDLVLRWEAPSGAPVDAYLVERHGPAGSRVLGRTALLEWDDRGPGPDDRWTVRAVRGSATSAPAAVDLRPAAETPPPPVREPDPSPLPQRDPDTPPAPPAPPAEPPPVQEPPPAEPPPPAPTPLRRPAPVPDPLTEPDLPPAAAAPALSVQSGPPVVVSWAEPAGADTYLERVQERAEGEVSRRLSVDGTSYTDRKVGRGSTYRYVLVTPGGRTEAVRVQVPGGAAAAPPAQAEPQPAPAAPAASTGPPALPDLRAERAPDGTLHLTWSWPDGVTEAYVVTAASPPAGSVTPDINGRKVTNMRYQLDQGVTLHDASTGAHIAVYAGRRDAAGRLDWRPSPARAVAP